ncbi:hypothetical protein B7494_g2829 [Chlorociboria aeruginascens]|nr:hypothetical protein B7494_g2829 [Chlorociboria aeruginascens]
MKESCQNTLEKDLGRRGEKEGMEIELSSGKRPWWRLGFSARETSFHVVNGLLPPANGVISPQHEEEDAWWNETEINNLKRPHYNVTCTASPFAADLDFRMHINYGLRQLISCSLATFNMPISTSNMGKQRSVRTAPDLAKPPSINPQPLQGPSNISLFLTNLRLLGLDLRDDWPGITAVALSTKDAQQNQKKRIQCVEWALYQLFALWDPEETRNKIQPFFPPLEPLQSLNLRAALFRSLDQAKKTGVLGRDTLLRKTMLDECKGERLEEVLAVFSNAVLKKVLQEKNLGRDSIAERLAFENFSYTGERKTLSSLILAHKCSLRQHLENKNGARARYKDFSDLLDLNERRIARRHEQLKESLDNGGSQDKILTSEVDALHNQVQKTWSGGNQWLETILYGESKVSRDGLLANSFDDVWKHVEDGSITDVEDNGGASLLEQLNKRVQSQEARLARWRDFGKTLSKDGSPSKKKDVTLSEKKKGIDLQFNAHQDIQTGRAKPGKNTAVLSSLYDYNSLVENMRAELAEVGKPKSRQTRIHKPNLHGRTKSPLKQPITPKEDPPPSEGEGWSTSSDSNGPSPGFTSVVTKSTSLTPLSGGLTNLSAPSTTDWHETTGITVDEDTPMPKKAENTTTRQSSRPTEIRIPSPEPRSHTPPRQQGPSPLPPNPETEMADQILNSISAASPSPKKTRHTLSLAERTRLSMSRTSRSQLSDLHEDEHPELPELPTNSINKSRNSYHARSSISEEDEKHAGLIERTRKSMAGFEAAQKKAQLERRKSMKDVKRRQRESSYFPRVEEEVFTPSIETAELIDGDPDYESVFKSRPKIKTSPAVSPTREMNYEDEGYNCRLLTTRFSSISPFPPSIPSMDNPKFTSYLLTQTPCPVLKFSPRQRSTSSSKPMSRFSTPPPHMPPTILLSFPGASTLLITLNNPHSLNSLNHEAHWALDDLYSWFDSEPSLRCAVLTGTGRAFCAGADLKEWDAANNISASNAERARPASGFGGLSRRRGKKPVICAVNGICVGGGCEMIINADIVVADAGAVFALPEVKVGVVALAGALPRLVRTIGRQRAMEMVLTGRNVGAEEAERWGVVNRVVESGQCVAEALGIARVIAGNSPDSVLVSREGVKLGWDGVGAEEGTRLLEENWYGRIEGGTNMKEGIRAFVEKRQPVWVPSKL